VTPLDKDPSRCGDRRAMARPIGRGERRLGEGAGDAALSARHATASRAVRSQRALVLASLLGCTVSRAAPAQRQLVIESLLRCRDERAFEVSRARESGSSSGH